MAQPVTSRAVTTWFAAITLGLYGVFSIATVRAATHADLAVVLSLVVNQMVIFGIALELAELVLATALKPSVHPMLPTLDLSGVDVAVLYCCCDDVDPLALQALRMLRDADIFLLDDSVGLDARRLIDGAKFPVVRRRSRDGFKAGNLNNWLGTYGQQYRYFIILDSDSIVTNEALWDLVRYAEHPRNQDVAIVQSSILGRGGNGFQRLASGVGFLRHRVLRNIHDRIGWTLSHGHNNLHRVAALQGINGFDLSASCEDTVVSLRLMEAGWRIILVNVLTYDAEPHNVFAHRRRSVRWARQTVDAIIGVRRCIDTRLALLLAQHLFYYMLPVAWLLAFALFAASYWNPEPARLVEVAVTASQVPWVASLSNLLWISMLSIIGLRLWHWRQRGGTCIDFMRFSLMSAAVTVFASLHVSAGLLSSLIVGPVHFEPTGQSQRVALRLSQFWRGMLVHWIWCVAAVAGLLTTVSPSDCVAVLLPLSAGACAPLVLWWFHRDQARETTQ